MRGLGPNFISKRPVGGGSHAAYLEGHTAVSLANEIFGFNGWSRSVTEETIDFVDHKEDKYFIGISAMVKVQLKDGAFHEDVGYGSSEGMKYGGAPHHGCCLSGIAPSPAGP